jgi:hypothetical protein
MMTDSIRSSETSVLTRAKRLIIPENGIIHSHHRGSGMLRRVALVRTDVEEELSASFIRVTRIGELGTTPAVTSNRRTLRRSEGC